MAQADAAVAADHDPRLRVDNADAFLFHRLPVHGRAAVAVDFHVDLDCGRLLLVRDPLERFELVIAMGGAVHGPRRRSQPSHRRRPSDRRGVRSERERGSSRATRRTD
jgi:hypothetical protein